ncbi:MAG: glycosyltransferase family 4 protein [Gaiellaceae bacterium]
MNSAVHPAVRVAHLVSHPIEYFVPLYRELALRPEIDLTVLFYSDATLRAYEDPGFGRTVDVDLPLLDGYRSLLLPSAAAASLSARLPHWDVVREAASGRYDVIWVHGYGWSTAWAARAAAAARGIPFLLREEATLLRPRRRWRRVVKGLPLRAFLHNAHGLYIGEANRQYLRHYGVPDARLHGARYCVDNSFFQERRVLVEPRREEIRRAFGIDDDAPVVLFCGKLIPVKRPIDLLRAFAEVREQLRIWLLIVGDGPLLFEVKQLAESERIRNVVLAGFRPQSQIHEAYCAADLFVLPSSSEQWGVVVNEAMNFSLPVVVSDRVGSGSDLVRQGWNGFVFPSGDVVALAKVIRSLATDETLRREFGERSRDLVGEFSVEACADGIVAACLDAATPGKPGQSSAIRSASGAVR